MIVESNNQKVKTILQVIIALGALLVWLTKDRLHSLNEKSAFAAGLAMFLLGCVGIIIDEKVWIEVLADKSVRVTKKKITGNTVRVLRPDQIASFKSIRVGRALKLPTYHLRIELKDGSHITTGRFSRNRDEIAMEAETLTRATGVTEPTPSNLA